MNNHTQTCKTSSTSRAHEPPSIGAQLQATTSHRAGRLRNYTQDLPETQYTTSNAHWCQWKAAKQSRKFIKDKHMLAKTGQRKVAL